MTAGYRYFVAATQTERGCSPGGLWRRYGSRWEHLRGGWWQSAGGPPYLVEIDPPTAERLLHAPQAAHTSDLAIRNPAGGLPRFLPLPLFAYCMLTSSMILTVGAALHIELEWSSTLGPDTGFHAARAVS